MKAGIVGLPNVGKSTLFNCLTNGKAQSANFPFCTIDPNFGAVTIPDERLNKLVKLIKPKKTIPKWKQKGQFVGRCLSAELFVKSPNAGLE